METDTIHRIYSQSKPVTGAALMMLFEEGKFLMTDPISKYFPEFAEMKVYTGGDGESMTTEAASSPITIQQLATHFRVVLFLYARTIGSMYVSEEVERGLGNVPSAGGEFFTAGTKPPFNNLREWTKALAEIPLVAQPELYGITV